MTYFFPGGGRRAAVREIRFFPTLPFSRGGAHPGAERRDWTENNFSLVPGAAASPQRGERGSLKPVGGHLLPTRDLCALCEFREIVFSTIPHFANFARGVG